MIEEDPPNGPKGEPGPLGKVSAGGLILGEHILVSGISTDFHLPRESAPNPLVPPDVMPKTIACPACEHGIDCHSLGDPCGAITVDGQCPCAWTPRVIAEHAIRRPKVAATLVRVGQNMGDHAQDVRQAFEVGPGETVEQLAERLLRMPAYHDTSDWRIEIQLVTPLPGTK